MAARSSLTTLNGGGGCASSAASSTWTSKLSRYPPTVEHESFSQDRARQHLAVHIHLRPQPLECRQANALIELRTHKPDGKGLVTADDDDTRVPTLHQEAGYAFRFRMSDRTEPPHVHVEGHGGRAKFWLADASLVREERYNRRQLAAIQQIVSAHADEWLRRWHEHFD